MSDTQQTNAESSGQPSSISILLNVITSPQKAFEDIRKGYPLVMPLLLLMITTAFIVTFLFSNIDYEWYVEQLVQATAGDLTSAEQDQQRQGMEMMSPGVMGAIFAVIASISIPVIFCIHSAYLVIVSNINNDGFQFKQWFSFVAWCSVPMLVALLAQFVTILSSSNGQLVPEALNPLSLNALFFNLDAFAGVGKLLASIDLTMFWSIALLTIGYSQWTGKNIASSLAIVITPYVLYFGGWFLLI